MPTRIRRMVALAALVALPIAGLAACSDDEGDTDDPTEQDDGGTEDTEADTEDTEAEDGSTDDTEAETEDTDAETTESTEG